MDSWSRDNRDERDDSRPQVDSYRRRSPDRRPRGGRGRSRSPVAIDRYQPGRNRDDLHYRGRDIPRRRSPPPPQAGIDRYVPGQDAPAPAVTHNPLPNPISLDYQVGFNFFAEWWRVEQQIKEDKERQKNGGRRPERVRGEREAREERGKEREQIQAAYDAYKEKLQVQMARTFVTQHKGDEWFKERYDPEVRNPLRERLNDFRRGNYSQWDRDVDAGVFDEFTLEGIYKNDSNGLGGIVEKEEGEATAANEVLGVSDLLPIRGGDLRDESAFQPTLLIKTIAPTVSRDKMESFCKEHLGEGDGGYKWLSLSDPNPVKKCHRIGWVILNPAPEPMKEDRRDDFDEDGEEGEEKGVDETETSKGAAEKAASDLNGKTIYDEVRGDFTCHVGVHEPPNNPRKKALWDLFSAPERIERDLQLAERVVMKLDEELGEDYDGLTKIEARVQDLRDQGMLRPAPTGSNGVKKEAKEDDDMEEGQEDVDMEEGEEDEGAYDEEVDDEELLTKKKKLDLLVEYLRRVFNFCFFCVFESDSVHELTRKCPGGHLRRPRSSLTSSAKEAARASASGLPFPLKRQESNIEAEAGSPVDEKRFSRTNNKNQQQLQRAFNWVKTFEDKLLQILEPDSVDIKKLGGRPFEEGLDEELTKYVKQEDESKFRCKVPDCAKLFKAHHFWKKHVEKRHPEWFEKLKQEVDLINIYVLDPAHIAPSRSDANSNGHFPVGGHAPTGTPRGFNLANMPSGFNLANFQAFLSQQGLSTLPGGGIGPADDDRHPAGPQRRQPGRFTARAPGPYDRPGKDARNARWGASGGRLTPPRAGGVGGAVGGARMGAGNPRFGGEGGPAMVGPREAVQGRSIKSYEDLDAVGGSGNGDLDY